MDNSKLSKIHAEVKRLNQERAILYSRRRLMGSIGKKMQTSMIGAIAACENIFGFLWGHNKTQEERTEEEQQMYQLWLELRTTILDKGNIQQRAAMEEISHYDISFNKYKTEFIVKKSERANNE